MKNTSMIVLSILALAIVVVALWSNVSPAEAAADATERTISVSGSGRLTVAPDTAVVRLAVETNRSNAADASQANAELMTKVQNTLTAVGVDKKDISTTGYSIYQRYDYVEGKRVSRGYDVSNYIVFKVRNLDKTGSLLDLAIRAGANRVDGITFTVEDSAKYTQELLTLAMQNAQLKADILLEAAGAKRGEVITISESSYQPLYQSDMNMRFADDSMKAMSVTPIQPEDLVLKADIHVVFRIN